MESNHLREQKKAKTSKKKQGECSQVVINHLDTWFTNKSRKNDYKMIYVVKNMRVPKYLDLEWFFQQGFNFLNLLEVQGLSKLVQMKGTFYPKLLKVFYTCAHADLEGKPLFYY